MSRRRSPCGQPPDLRRAAGAPDLSRIRVLRVIARLNLGGPAQQAALLSGRRLDPARFETLLVHGALASGEESMADLAHREMARMEYLPSLSQAPRPHRDAAATLRLARIVRQFRPHVVHTHTAKAGFVGRSAALAAGDPAPILVHTYHGHVLEGYFGPVRNQIYRSLERGLGRRTDCLVGVSEATVSDLVRLGVAPRERFRVIPLGLELDGFANADEKAGRDLRRELGIDDEDVVLTFVGRLVPIKRVDLLLRAFAIARTRARVRLLVVGDGELAPELRELSDRLGVSTAVSFLGYRRDLPRIAAAADIAVLASANEGTPVSLIEAAAAGRPAVATRVGGVAEVVTGETGVLAPRGDIEALAAGITRLANDLELRARLGLAARERAIERHSVPRLLRDVEDLYDKLLDRRTTMGE
ncbi:MAG: glycosyltransferase [Actinomycetota bacterium]|nr:glycosyltransferase [Actinomycetota bacterium]